MAQPSKSISLSFKYESRELFDVGYEVENTAIHLLTSFLLLDVLE